MGSWGIGAKWRSVTLKDRSAWSLLCAGVAILVLAGTSCRRAKMPTESIAQAPDFVANVAPLPDKVQRGISFVHSWEGGGARGYGSPTSRRSLQELRTLGATWISVMPFGFVAALDADDVQFLDDDEASPGRQFRAAGETRERVRRQIADAHELGLKVFLKPHLWVRRGAWCGEISPSTPERAMRFFERYGRFVLHHARLAQDAGADLFSVGVEMCSMSSGDPARWRELIRQVRQIYHGPLVYAANWDEASRVPFWDALDYIGVQFYAPLADTVDATDAVMSARLATQLEPLGELARRTHKQVLFTEVGYKAIRGTAVQPHLWPEQLRKSDVEISLPAQAQAYRVFFQGVRLRPWLGGVYIWKWFSDPESTEEDAGGFSPRAKPAESVLRAAFRPTSTVD